MRLSPNKSYTINTDMYTNISLDNTRGIIELTIILRKPFLTTKQCE